MTNGIDYGAIIKLAEMKINEPEKYEKIIKAISEVSKDMIKITYEAIQEMQKNM